MFNRAIMLHIGITLYSAVEGVDCSVVCCCCCMLLLLLYVVVVIVVADAAAVKTVAGQL